MGWSGGTYTKGNAGTGGWTGDQTGGIGIEAGRHDTQDNDFATGINNCLTKDGQNSATANLPMGGFKHTNCANASADTEYTTLGQIRAGVAVQNAALSGPTISSENYNNGNVQPRIHFVKSRNGSVGGNTIVQNGDGLGGIYWYGASGTSYNTAALLSAEVDGVPGATNDMPGRLLFYTTADGAGSPTERMRLTSTGVCLIGRTTELGLSEKLAVGDGTGKVRAYIAGGVTNADDGPALMFNCGSSQRFAIGAYSNILGGAFDASPTLWASPLSPNYKVINLPAGAGTWPMKYNTTTFAWTYDTSRRSEKDNIRDCKYGLDAILALKARQFNYLETNQFREDVGFIADEIHPIIPELAPCDQNGEPAGVSYDRLTAVLCKAIQELNAKVQLLQARIEALESAA